MTIDYDYELNWNKENIPIGGTLKKKAITFERSSSKRSVLGELHGIVAEQGTPKRGRSQSQPTMPLVTDYDMEVEKQKWAKIALTLRCDKESNDEQLMEELLNLCSWYDDHEKPIAAWMQNRRSSCDLWDDYSDEEDEDDAFLAYVRSQQMAFSASHNKQPLISPFHANSKRNISNDLHLSSLHLKSRLSLFDSPQCSFCANDRNGADLSASPRTLQPLNMPNGCSVEIPDGDAKDDSLKLMANVRSSSSKTAGFFTSSNEANGISSSEMLEKAFLGVVAEDNDVVQWSNQLAPLKPIYHEDESKKESKESQISGAEEVARNDHDFWADVDFY